MRHLFLVLALAGCDFERTNGEGPQPPPPSVDAVALARATITGAPHLVLVTDDDGAVIDGLDLGPLAGEVLARVQELGGIPGVVAAAETGTPVQLGDAELLPPVVRRGISVEVGANYPDPEALVDEPFLYPNAGAPAPATGSLAIGDAKLIDYQAMICATLGVELASADALADAPLGLFLCEHTVDRAIQLEDDDLDHPERAVGLPAAGRPDGFWRTGPYMVVARDPAAVLADTVLHLEVSGDVRQDARVAAMAWPLDEIARRTLAAGNAKRWKIAGQGLALVPGTTLPRDLVFLTGTPAGVAFRGADARFRDTETARYAATGAFLSQSLSSYLRERLVAREEKSDRYLRRGDRVVTTATHLGRIALEIR